MIWDRGGVPVADWKMRDTMRGGEVGGKEGMRLLELLL
jgi:hypothetical protein